jgi:RND family efflux transporter MFP subunit
VKEGDVLCEIDPRPFQAAVEAAQGKVAQWEAKLTRAEADVERNQRLLPKGAASQKDLDTAIADRGEARAAIQTAQAELDRANLDLEFTKVTAPIVGRIGRALVTKGNLVVSGETLLTTIVSLDPIYAYFEADEASFLKYIRLAQSGQRPSSREHPNPVHLALGDETGFPHEGTMDFVDNQLDRGTGTIVGRALVPNPDLLLAPGLFARLQLQGSGLYNAILVPDEAIASDQSQKFVYVVDADGKSQYRTVKVGPLVDGLRVVREGLAPEDWVVVAGIQRIKPGAPVDAQRETIPPPAHATAEATPPTSPPTSPTTAPAPGDPSR